MGSVFIAAISTERENLQTYLKSHSKNSFEQYFSAVNASLFDVVLGYITNVLRIKFCFPEQTENETE